MNFALVIFVCICSRFVMFNKKRFLELFHFVISERSREVLVSRLDYFERGFYLLRSRNRDLIRRNNSLKREVRHLQNVIYEHEDFLFGDILEQF